ncbi:hypothetical protein ACFVAE_16795 [Microbacterium sp. NPDC057659]|uniref:hypothetical protein n=1 Tax=Microbacterium sp. NPDC057659 TaxID=3346198 RepID=UPI003670DF23
MGGPGTILIVMAIAIIVAIVWLIVHRRGRAELPERIAPVVAAARRRVLFAVLTALLVFVIGAALGLMLPDLLGLPLAVTPLVSAAAGLLVYAATPPRDVEVDADEPRSARLEHRSWRSFIPRGWVHACIEIVVVFVAVVLCCGVTATDDEQGRSRAIGFTVGGEAAAGTPYPGWYYGVPALIGLALLVAATIVALQGIGSTAVFPRPEDAESDAQWRQASASVVLKLSIGAVLLSLGGIAWTAGALMSVTASSAGAPAVWVVVGNMLLWGGIVALVLSVVSATLAALTAFTVGERMSTAPESVR